MANSRMHFFKRPDWALRSVKTVLVYSLLIAVAAIVLLPLVWMFVSSFKPFKEIFSPQLHLLPIHPTLDNFKQVLTEFRFLHYMLNTTFVAGTITLIALIFHSMAGYALARLTFPGRDLIFSVILSTLLITLPMVVIPLYIFVHELGWTDSYVGLIIPATFHAFGIFMLRQFYQGVPRELEDAAFIDGCSHFQVYWYVILPLSTSIMGALAVFFFLANWNSFLWPTVVVQNQDLWLIQVAISGFKGSEGTDWQKIMAASTIAVVPILALFFAFQRQIMSTVKATGLK